MYMSLAKEELLSEVLRKPEVSQIVECVCSVEMKMMFVRHLKGKSNVLRHMWGGGCEEACTMSVLGEGKTNKFGLGDPLVKFKKLKNQWSGVVLVDEAYKQLSLSVKEIHRAAAKA